MIVVVVHGVKIIQNRVHNTSYNGIMVFFFIITRSYFITIGTTYNIRPAIIVAVALGNKVIIRDITTTNYYNYHGRAAILRIQ